MEATVLDGRQQRGLDIAKGKSKKIRHVTGDTWLVPSSTNTTAGYVVDIGKATCSCPDHETRGVRCKHLWAIAYVRREVTLPDGSTLVTEQRITYRQDWRAYNAAQTEEKDRVQILLRGLCDGIAQPKQERGRPRLPLADVVYGATMKVYTTMSGRRAASDIRACAERGLVDKAPSYNSLFRYMEQPEMTALLKSLVEQSSLPLRAIEQDFAVDGTGFSTNTYARWFDHKYGEEKRSQRWIKAHAMVGVVTNVVTAIETTESNVHDSPMLAPLLTATAANFNVRELSADKGYLGHGNLAAIEAVGAKPFVPFKSNSRPDGSPAWERLWHLYSLHREEFLRHYHKRSNVESTFSMLKRKFGTGVRSKLLVAQMNEVLLKVLCHNLSVLVHSIHELGIEPRFWIPEERP